MATNFTSKMILGTHFPSSCASSTMPVHKAEPTGVLRWIYWIEVVVVVALVVDFAVSVLVIVVVAVAISRRACYSRSRNQC